MPKIRKYEIVHCTHFTWRLTNRSGTWYADGRSNTPSAGRHSLGTKEKKEALKLLPELDRVRTEDMGLVPHSTVNRNQELTLPLDYGRKLYEQHIARSRVAGGVRKSTQKRYRTVFEKFIPFAASRGVTVWNGVTAGAMTAYISYLEEKGYAHKTLVNEITTLKQAITWLIKEEHVTGMQPIELKLRKAESQPAYCNHMKEVKAMVERSRSMPSIDWLANVITALACTGLRIAELASLRWADLDLDSGRLTLTDETGQSIKTNRDRRELKSGRSRSFPIHPDLLVVLKRLSLRDSYVFHGPRGGRLKPATVRRILVREVINPLMEQFPTLEGERGFKDGRLHSFRHYFCSTCANNGVPERMVMDWLGHTDSKMIRHYYHLHDEESRRRMNELNFLGGVGGRSPGDEEEKPVGEDAEPPISKE